MPIPSTRYVVITSGVAGASAVAQRELVHLRFSDNLLTPVDTQLEFSSAGLVADYYGSSTPEAQFALQYFGYVSPAPASKPAKLKFATYAPTGRAPTLFGDVLNQTLAQLKTITAGSLDLSMGENTASLNGINLSAATTLQDIGNIIQTALQLQTGFTSATVTHDALNRRYVITTNTVGEAEVGAASGTIAAALNLNGPLAVKSAGSAIQTAYDAFRRAEQVSDSFGTSSIPESLGVSLDDATVLAQYIAGLNIKYQHYWPVSTANALEWSDVMIGMASSGVVLNATAGEFKEAIPAAVSASVDYDRRNSVVNFMFRSPTITMTPDVKDELLANVYDPKRINYYGQTAMYGQNISFFQRGYLGGNQATVPVDMGVHLNEQWLKSLLSARFMNLLIVKGIVPANNDGRGYGMNLINEAATQAKFNGTMISGKTLTATQISEITSISGDELAHHDVVNNGYWADAVIIRKTGPSQIEEFVLQYTLIYSANAGVRKVEGSHNLII